MQLFIGLLFWVRLMSVLCFCFFECGKGLVFPLGLVILYSPVLLIEAGHAWFRYWSVGGVHQELIGTILGTLVVGWILGVLVRPITRTYFRTDWRSQLGPLLIGLAYLGYLARLVWSGCWSPDYWLYAAVPVGTFAGVQVLIALLDWRQQRNAKPDASAH